MYAAVNDRGPESKYVNTPAPSLLNVTLTRMPGTSTSDTFNVRKIDSQFKVQQLERIADQVEMYSGHSGMR